MNGDIKMRTRKAYTLIEILLVLALISILSSIAVPNLSLYKKMKENIELRTLKKDLMFARNSSILEGVNYTVEFDYLNNSYIVRNNISNSKAIKSVYFKSGLKLNNRSGTIKIQFNRSGKVGKADTISFKNSKNENIDLMLTPVTGNINIKTE